MNQRRISVEVIDLKCNETASWGTDDVYFISTLNCQPKPRNFDITPKKVITEPVRISETIEGIDDDNVPHQFKRKAFDKHCYLEKEMEGTEEKSEMIVTGNIYFIQKNGKRDLIEQRPKLKFVPVVTGFTFFGLIFGLATLPFLVITFGPVGILLGLGIWVGSSALGALFTWVTNLLYEDSDDDYLFAITPFIPVKGDKGPELDSGSPYQRKGEDEVIQLRISSISGELEGTGFGSLEYEISLRITRGDII